MMLAILSHVPSIPIRYAIQSATENDVRIICSNICLAVAITLQFLDPSIYSILTGFIFGILFLGAILRPAQKRGPRLIYGGICLILGSAFVALPISAFLGNLAPTIILAALTLGNWLYFYAAPTRHIFYYLIPLWGTHCAVALYQWFISDQSRVTGLTPNANATAGMLLLAAVWMMHTRFKWMSLPFVVAMLFTGSRWTTVVAVLVLGGIFLFQSVPRKWLLPGLAGIIGLVVILNLTSLLVGFRIIDGSLDQNIERFADDTNGRFDLAAAKEIGGPVWWLIPKGFVNSGMHSLPIRMAFETGLISALAWVGMTAWTIKKANYKEAPFWMMVTLGLLSVMYYHIWLGPNAPMWWLLLSVIHRRDDNRDYVTAELVEGESDGLRSGVYLTAHN